MSIVVDEDHFTIPVAWLRGLHPRRGGVRAPAKRLDPGAAAKVAAALGKYRELVDGCLALCTDAELAAAGAAHLAGEPDSSALGAAVVAEAVASCLNWDESKVLLSIAETWLTERGLVFAVTATAELSALQCGGEYQRNVSAQHLLPVRRLAADGQGRWWGGSRRELFRRVRAAVAEAADDEYAEVAGALARCREAGPRQRVAASYLAPTERAWVDADCAEAAGLDPDVSYGLILAISTPAQAALIADLVQGHWVRHEPGLPATVVDGLGGAAAPLLAAWFDDAYDPDEQRLLLAMLAELPTDEAMRALIERADRTFVQPALLSAAARYPRRAMRLLAEGGGKVVDELLKAHVRARPDLVAEVLADLTGPAAERVAAVEAAPIAPAAPPGALPDVLVVPPWSRDRTVRTPVVVSGLVCTDEPTVAWGRGERDAWRSSAPEWCRVDRRDWPPVAVGGAPGYKGWYEAPALFVSGPDDLAVQLIEVWRPDEMWRTPEWVRAVAARFESAALPLVVDMARRNPTGIAPALVPFATPGIASLMAEWLGRLKTVRATALTWLARHPDAAARALVPAALGRAGAARHQAEQALSALAARGGRDAVIRAAAGHGPAAEAAITALLDADPLDALPATMPVVPEWADPLMLPPILLRGGGATLPVEAARHVVTMFSVSRPGDPYAGIAVVKEACDGQSLADFGWALFQRWRAAGHPPATGWIFDALALVGDDETVRRLTPVIRAWPGEGGFARAVTGLEILTTLGTEVALMHLHSLAEKGRFNGLKNRARQKMAEVAARLDLSPEELADRLVPGFGLAADGSLTLDYGPRRFVVGFDEQLKPYVVDAAGKRLKSLPKPGVKDDAELAPEAYRRFAGLKKDVRTVAADTIHRLERAMVDRRRWSAGDFTRLFVGHPLLWHITRRLVWGCYDAEGRQVDAFRVAEDRGFADVDDETLTLRADVEIGLVHPLELGEALGLWAEVFADYEILQPFPQLGREVFTVAAGFDTERFGRVPTGRVIGLERRGWRRTSPQDAGWQGGIEREVPGGRITVGLNPGVSVGYVDMDADQELIVSTDDLTGLDPVTASEIMRDLQELIR
ncbi:DUF4132 domain-containing protein [Herbidospora daliensis]|uniref:DUF4132 domain-containing protein n=1 Tax=Herbidospora daliensis TaxID=295585 RepID=UPI000784160E|nr:DUF4132 domain-containing protein [Herbidospora daliensis]